MGVDQSVVARIIGAKISYWRTLRGLSQSELGKKAALSRVTISKIERGVYNETVSISNIIQIADALGIDFTLLLNFSNQERSMWITTTLNPDDNQGI